jgi:hypothetical protein
MISSQSLQTEPLTGSGCGGDSHGEAIGRHLSAAERELGAFLFAVGELYGPRVADSAARYWLEFAESLDMPLLRGRLNWRGISIIAARRLAVEASLTRGPHGSGTSAARQLSPDGKAGRAPLVSRNSCIASDDCSHANVERNTEVS